MGHEEDPWIPWSKHVLENIKEFKISIKDLELEVHKMSQEFTELKTALKVKAAIWGTVSGAAVGIITAVMAHLIIKSTK